MDLESPQSYAKLLTFLCNCNNYLQVLRARDEIANVNLSRELPKTSTPLNSIIEDIVIYNEELANLSITNDSTN
jgi:hypothetical protein